MKWTIIAKGQGSKKLARVRFVFSEDKLPVPSEEFNAKLFSTFFERDKKQLWVGLGEKHKVAACYFSQASGATIQFFQKIGITEAIFDLTHFSNYADDVVEGAVVGGYFFDTFLPEARKLKKRFQQVILEVQKQHVKSVQTLAKQGLIRGEATNFTRSLGDLPGNYVYPEILAQTARDLTKQFSRLKVTVLDEKQLVNDGFGGLTAVGSGSMHPPRLIILEYRGGKPSQRPIALVGKAITFDSGGISIKPADKMDEMKFDKMGGCTVLGVMQAIARLQLKENVVGIVASAENLLSSRSYRPGDVVTTYDGKTIEVLNTDAEGRVVLADALAYARIHFKPTEIIDLATLTGAIIIALGSSRAGLFSNCETLTQQLKTASEAVGEKIWEMPHDEPFHDQIKSDIALVKNTGGREGGSCTAAAFLEKWVEETPWAHIDIAGTAWRTRELPYATKGATGFGVRLLIEYLNQK
ncbi:MAG: leucyl aminopeptidase [Verrucomicrobiae bacterium]|nr:leucyl aminopeptidase [Verrucomicrobiae bacterium]